jgi:outer membrane lipoprotein-sorting protein
MRNRHSLVLSVLAVLCLPGALCAAAGKVEPAKPAAARLSVTQILERHIAARGGPQAWHGVHTMSWSGKLEVGYADSVARSQRYVSNAMIRSGKMQRMALLDAEKKAQMAKQVELPFVLEMKRPDKSRIELEFAGNKAVQLYDGKEGWMKRPFLNRDDWEPFSAEQAKSQVGRWDLDGPLLDYAAKGTKVELESVEKVEGNDAYKLKLTLATGEVQHVWIDARSFLDVKIEGAPRRMDGRLHSVWVYQRDFRAEMGIMVPHVLETAVEGYPDTHKMFIEKVVLNANLDDSLFVRPRS